MEAIVWFKFGPIHVPLGLGRWKHGSEIPIESPRSNITLQIRRPIRIHTHLLDDEDPESKVGDAYVPVLVLCDLVDDEDCYRDIADMVVRILRPLVEEIRVRTRQPHLRLRGFEDLEVQFVQTPDGDEISELTNSFQSWMINQERDRPLPFIDLEDWKTLQEYASVVPTEHDHPVPLFESLLLDAELELESNPNVGVLFSALACEVFIQNWLRNRAEQNSHLQRWLDSINPARVSVMDYYDLGVFLASERSPKEDHGLWSALGELNTARNNVAHRGSIGTKYNPGKSISTARNIIDWVQRLISNPPDLTQETRP